MAVTSTVFYRGQLGTTANPGATLFTTTTGTTVVTNIVVTNVTTADTTVSLTFASGGSDRYILYNAAIAANSTITLDISQVMPASTAVKGRSAAACDMHISGVLIT